MLPPLAAGRYRQPELMDDPAIDPGVHQRALAGLGRINRVSGAADPLFARIASLARQHRDRPLRVLDLACGGGDVALALDQRAREAGLNIEIHGCDISTTALALAEASAARTGARVRFFPLDVLCPPNPSHPLPPGFDVICCTLFFHHLDDESAGDLLRRMAAAARKLVLISDLDRTPLGYLAAWIGTRLLSRSRVVHVDGTRSVRAAFTRAEIARLAGRAGLEGAIVRPIRPWRWLLEWSRP